MIIVRHEVRARAPAARCFDLARNVDLHVASAADIAARAVGGRTGGLSGMGDETTWSARFCGVRFTMVTRVEDFAPPTGFGDRLTRGLLREFAHRYRFTPLPDGGCMMSDELTVTAPFGLFGKLAERLYLARRMCVLVRRRLEYLRRVAEGDDWQRYLS